VRIPYNAETKKARTRSIFVGKKWLEIGYNPKDVWSVTGLHKIDEEREMHPTQKPLEIIERIVKAGSPTDDIVLDLFLGSGTTAVACVGLRRNYIGFEISSEYCQNTEKRLSELQNNIPLLEKLKHENEKQNLFIVTQSNFS
jgi:site-specific DNA-methyltransferase (adenine-specific)